MASAQQSTAQQNVISQQGITSEAASFSTYLRDRDSLMLITASFPENALLLSRAHARESTRSLRDKKELWSVVHANARYARDVAAAVTKRDLNEIKRIIDRAHVSRRDFSSVCERLGFAASAESRDADSPHDPNSNDYKSTTKDDSVDSATQANVDVLGSEKLPPVFFLDAEGPGGTTALALATVLNDPETVRRLLKMVSARCLG